MDNNKMETGEPSTSTDGEKMETDEPTKDESLNKKIDAQGKYDWTEKIKPHRRIAVIGEEGCGKTSMILAFRNKNFPHYEDKYCHKRHYLKIVVDGVDEKCMVAEIDDWDRKPDRQENPQMSLDVVLMCFNQRQVLKQLDEKWASKLKEKNVPVIYVMIKKKLEIGEVCHELMTYDDYPSYMECCPHANIGVQKVFENAVRVARKN